MKRYLVKRATGAVFIWTENLAKRKDLDEVYAGTPSEAVDKPSIADPRKVSISDIEAMSKADILIFATVKLNLKVSEGMTKGEIQDLVKEAVILQPTTDAEAAATTVGPFATGRDALSRAGDRAAGTEKPHASDNADQPVRA